MVLIFSTLSSSGLWWCASKLVLMLEVRREHMLRVESEHLSRKKGGGSRGWNEYGKREKKHDGNQTSKGGLLFHPCSAGSLGLCGYPRCNISFLFKPLTVITAEVITPPSAYWRWPLATPLIRSHSTHQLTDGFSHFSSSLPLFLSPAPTEPLLCKFADGGQKKRQSQSKYPQNGRPWPREGEVSFIILIIFTTAPATFTLYVLFGSTRSLLHFYLKWSNITFLHHEIWLSLFLCANYHLNHNDLDYLSAHFDLRIKKWNRTFNQNLVIWKMSIHFNKQW